MNLELFFVGVVIAKLACFLIMLWQLQCPDDQWNPTIAWGSAAGYTICLAVIIGLVIHFLVAA
jgi:predicted cobalt transporter CbtA